MDVVLFGPPRQMYLSSTLALCITSIVVGLLVILLYLYVRQSGEKKRLASDFGKHVHELQSAMDELNRVNTRYIHTYFQRQ